ncbi:MAG: ribosomal protein S18-alanine N-acetyltransferase [Bryobacteraceae bacterium]
MHLEVRRGDGGDLEAIARIQAASPEASQWDVRDYAKYDLTVAVCDGQVAGFAVSRRVAEDEGELLNLAVDPAFRRRGIGRRMVAEVAARCKGTIWLEVRESNWAARKLYESLGFREAGRRVGYYPQYNEGAIVMKIHS